MRDYGRIATRYWTDPRILPLSKDAKLVGAYLMSGPQTNIIGCFRLTPSHIEADGVCTARDGADALSALADAKFIDLDKTTGLVRLRQWFRYNPIVNKDMGTGALRAILQCQPSSLLASVVECLHEFADKMPHGWVDECRHLCLDACPDGSGHTDTETETEAEAEAEAKTEAKAERRAAAHGAPLVQSVLDDLNRRTGSRFRPCKATATLIAARAAEGATLEDFQLVHERCCREWGRDDKMRSFLKPSTIYRASHFADYLGQAQGERDRTARKRQQSAAPAEQPESPPVDVSDEERKAIIDEARARLEGALGKTALRNPTHADAGTG